MRMLQFLTCLSLACVGGTLAAGTLLDSWTRTLGAGSGVTMAFAGDSALAVVRDNTSSDRLYHSVDGGLTWEQLDPPEFETSENSNILAVCSFEGVLYVFERSEPFVYGEGQMPVNELFALDPSTLRWIHKASFAPPGLGSRSDLAFLQGTGSWYAVSSAYTPAGGPHDEQTYSVAYRGNPEDGWTPLAETEERYAYARSSSNGDYFLADDQWSSDLIEWYPIPTEAHTSAAGTAGLAWPVGLCIPTADGFAAFGPDGVRLVLSVDTGAGSGIVRGTERPTVTTGATPGVQGRRYFLHEVAADWSDWVSSGPFETIEDIVRPEAKLGDIYTSGRYASYDLITWFQLPVSTRQLARWGDRLYDTSTGSLSPPIRPWPLAERLDADWIEDLRLGWIYDEHYPWAYIYPPEGGVEPQWFHFTWWADGQGYIWSLAEENWLWTSAESWPRAWSYARNDWIGDE